ncbi:hypothetical protein RB195_014373 [Necator americanus]|uniref:SXP/RAL-2 family protein Ani s 5-like cation-binding domain-containing protein n=1 Tax=Necator americanus TaxID=51031 RepID=A0ABR1DZT5_NECAM
MTSRTLWFITLLSIVATVFPKPQMESRNVRIGIVPIFDGRTTNEPITFTFTTARPSLGSTVYPDRHNDARILPTLSPLNHKESLVQTNYHVFNDKWQYTRSQTPNPLQTFTTPIYNQAQYYRAIQAGLISAQRSSNNSPYKTSWMQIGDSWNQMKSTLISSGIEKDWRSLWGKLTGAMEPFISEISDQLGRIANIFLKQQKARFERELERQNLHPFRLFREERSQKTLSNLVEDKDSVKV